MASSARYIDVDGHILEPSGIWEEYIEPKYRDRTIKILKDDKGLEYLSIEGKASFFSGGTLGALGAMGQDVRPFREPGQIEWEDPELPRGGYDPDERIKVMDAEGIDQTLIYPSLGLLTETECGDAELAAANCRAYNNWVFDFCKTNPTRLIPVSHIPTLDVEEGVKELRRTVKLGAKAMMITSRGPADLPYGGHYFDPLWREAEGLGVPVTLHPADPVPTYLYTIENANPWWMFVQGAEDVKMQFTTIFNEGTFERFPQLKLVVLESGIGWLVPWLKRMDEKFRIYGYTTPMKKKPSEYFERNCWISMDPDDEMVHFNVQHLGSDRMLWAYDFPHSDAVTEPIVKLKKNLAPLPLETRNRITGENAAGLYHL